ncbi:MAG: NAD(P)/FAD-dependent oxidoreductase, partial [Thaumarchaeota archaeon]|nr:NAD(P)/FAD-dependent oxidoreductase [Nitrososphaerota archaeon]
MKNVIILGGGVGGTIVANALAKRFDTTEVQVTLISDSSKHVYLPGLISIAMGHDGPESIARSEKSLLSSKVHFLDCGAEKIEAKENRVFAGGSYRDYDYLIVATGSRLVPDEIPGYSEAALHFYSVEGALRLREKLSNFTGGKLVIGVASVPYRCPPAPLEFTFLIDEYFTRKGIRDKVDIEYLYPINGVFPIRDVEPMLAKLLEERKVTARTLFNTESIDPVKREVHSLEGESVGYDMLVMVPPHRGSKLIENSGLGDRGGWMPTDRRTLKVKAFDNVYALGDATDIPISKAGSTAHYEAKIVSDSLISNLEGLSEPPKQYDGHVFCFLETGYGKGITLNFDYSHPPKPSQPNRLAHMEKIA